MNIRVKPSPQRELRHGSLRVAVCGRAASCVAVALAALIASAPLLAAEDEGDAAYVHPLVNQALETEKTDVEIPWANPETGNRGVIVVERTFYRDEQPCREYRRSVSRPGSATLVIEGVGCRVGAGRWELEEEPAAEASELKPDAVEPAAGPAREQPEQSARGAAQPSASGTEAATETNAASETEGAPEKAAAEPPARAEDTPEAAPPEPPPFPDYTMPTPASL